VKPNLCRAPSRTILTGFGKTNTRKACSPRIERSCVELSNDGRTRPAALAILCKTACDIGVSATCLRRLVASRSVASPEKNQSILDYVMGKQGQEPAARFVSYVSILALTAGRGLQIRPIDRRLSYHLLLPTPKARTACHRQKLNYRSTKG
jgi:hypothetical protein